MAHVPGTLSCSTMHFSLVLVLISLVHVLGCDLTGGPVDMQKKAEAQLRQYFPKGHVIVSPEQKTISAVTCTEGLGKPVIEEMGKYLAKCPELSDCKRLGSFP